LTGQLQAMLDAQGQALDWVQSRLGRPSALVAAHRVSTLQLQQRMHQALSKRMPMLGQKSAAAQTALMRVVQSEAASKRQSQQQLGWRCITSTLAWYCSGVMLGSPTNKTNPSHRSTNCRLSRR